MKVQKGRCKHCHCLFILCPKVPKHEYCNKKECQRARRNIWQRKKMEVDESYQRDQKDAQKLWRENNSDYWKKYRSRNNEYTGKNREKQRERNLRRRKLKQMLKSSSAAKMDTLEQTKPVFSGRYNLIPIGREIAKMDALIVEISAISGSYAPLGR